MNKIKYERKFEILLPINNALLFLQEQSLAFYVYIPFSKIFFFLVALLRRGSS